MTATATEVTAIPLDAIDPNPDQPRKFFDEAKLEELAAQFRSVGQLQPIVVRAIGDRFQLVMGERRWRAMHLVDGATTIEAKIVQSVDDERAFVMGISENIGRADMTLMEEAQAYADLVGFGYEAERVAEMFGKTCDYVVWRMDLLNLTTDVAELLMQGLIKPDFAWYVSKLKPANQKVAVTRYMKGDFKTEAEAGNFAQALSLAEKQDGFFSEKELSEVEKQARTKERKKARSHVEQVEAAGVLLDQLAKKTPTELAELFEGEVGRHLDALDRVHKAVTEARKKMRKAKSISEARTLAVRPELEIEQPTEAEPVDEAEPTEVELEELEAETMAAA